MSQDYLRFDEYPGQHAQKYLQDKHQHFRHKFDQSSFCCKQINWAFRDSFLLIHQYINVFTRSAEAPEKVFCSDLTAILTRGITILLTAVSNALSNDDIKKTPIRSFLLAFYCECFDQ